MASALVQVKAVGVWTDVAASDVVIERSLSSQTASFRVDNATVADRVYLNQWSEVHIIVDYGDGNSLTWAGVVTKALVEVASPVAFNLVISCAGMELKASTRYRGALNFAHGTQFIGSDTTDMLHYTWSEMWGAVDRSRVVADVTARTYEDDAEQQLEFRYVELSEVTDRIVREFVDNYHWWLEWEGAAGQDGTLYLRAEPQGYVDNGRTLAGEDLQFSFQMEPTNLNVRNSIIGIGGQSDVLNPTAPIAQVAQDLSSIETFGLLWLIVVDPSMDRQSIVDQRVVAELAGRSWPLWRLQPIVFNYALELNEMATLDLPALGLDGENFGRKFVVASIKDEIANGDIVRTVLFVEDYFSYPVG